MKRNIFQTLFPLLFFLAVPFCSQAYGFEVDGLRYTKMTNSKVEVSGHASKNISGSLVIPATVAYDSVEYSVTSIGFEAFFGCSGLTSVAIPNSVSYIAYEAFYGCSGLTSVTIPNSVTTISDYAFSGCSGLTSVTIPNSVTSIGANPFSACTNLETIKVESGNTNYDSREDCNAIIETSNNSLISGCKNTVIPTSVTSISYSAFSGCSGLTSVTIPNSVTSIKGYAFNFCSGITSVTIPNTVTWIGTNPFAWCANLETIKVESGNTNYDSREDCNAIIETSNNSLISGCKNTAIPNSVTSILLNAFSGCSGLTSITVPNSVKRISAEAFSGCSGLKSVAIGSSIAYIQQNAFYECKAIEAVQVLATTAPFPSSNMFSDDTYSQAALYIPKGCCNAYIQFADWAQFSNIVESSFIKGDVDLDEVVNSSDATALVNHLLNVKSVPHFSADTNADTQVNTSDVANIISIILSE